MSVTRKQQKDFLQSIIAEVVAEIEMEDDAERNGTLHPDLVKERIELRSRIRALCQPVDEVAENIRIQKEFDEMKQMNEPMEIDTSFFAGVTLEEMDELQKMDSD